MKFTVDQFLAFSEQFEGKVPTMYRDKKNLVSVGYGNLIEPIQLAWGLKWMRDGREATQSEVIAEWNIINDAENLDRDGWRAAMDLKRPGGLTPLYLTDETMVNLVKMRLGSNEAFIIQGFPGYDAMCADAQLFLHSMAWACGGMFWGDQANGYPRLRRLINVSGFGAAKNECDINPKIGTIILRNAANKQLLTNAAIVRDSNLDASVLYYPKTANAGSNDFDHTVHGIQHALSLLGFIVTQDGIMGPKTQYAIKKFQAIHKLAPDGVVGPLTRSALEQALRFR